MTPVNVLVVFYSRYGETEKRALAAGVGAIQARANIRLRRLADLAAMETIQADAAWSENLERMKKDYIAPREIDAQWADVLILAAPEGQTVEMKQYLAASSDLLKGKLVAVLGAFAEAASTAGLELVAADENELDYGRRAAETGGARKASIPQ